MECLGQVADPRSRRGLRYELGFLLAVVVAARACAGHDEVAAQAQWAADAPVWVLRALGARPDPLTGAIVVGATRARDGDSTRLSGVAIDGKSVRGAGAGGGRRPHLLGAATHDRAIILAQRQIPDKGSEITELAGLVAELYLAGTVVIVDALHTQRATAQHLVSVKGADYLMTIKANQPSLLATTQHALSGPATDFAEDTEHSRGHGRTEERILRTTPVTAHMPLDFPHAAQIFRVTRYVGGLDGQRRSNEVAHCITGLTTNKANAPDLAHLLREHWGAIENKTHWVRDTTFMEQPQTSPPPLLTRHQPMRRPHHQTGQNGQTSN